MDQGTTKNTKIIGMVCVFALIALLVVIGVFFLSPQKNTQNNLARDKNNELTPTPTPGPFDDMTIPFLRNKVYSGELGELSQIGTNQGYTSYLTNYTSDGLKINAQITVPNTDRPLEGYPAVIFIHGYIPPTIYQTLSNYSAYVDYLARNGFVVLKIDLRGHADSEGEATGAYYSGDYIIDTLNAYNALQNFSDVNPDAIGIWGHSMAGNVAFRSLAARPEIPAAVIWAGAVYSYSDMQEYGIDDNSYSPPSDDTNRQRRRDLLFKTYGQFDPKNPFWSKVAATNYIDDINGAIQLNHAVDDAVVNIEYSRGLAKLLSQANKKYELKEYSSGGHNISGASFNQAMANTVTFFKEHLQ